MIMYHPLFGNIEIPDRKDEILNELNIATEVINREYSQELQAYIDVLNDGLDLFRDGGGESSAI